VVTRDVEPYTVVAGQPARVIRRLQRPVSKEEQAAAAEVAAATVAEERGQQQP